MTPLFGLLSILASTSVGGHLGVALPIVVIDPSVHLLGRDLGTVGLTTGVTFKLDAQWSIDFEVIALSEVRSGGVTTFVVDPGVLRSFGPIVAGLRLATQVGAPLNLGVVPIAVMPFKISDVFSYFVEVDVPVFFRGSGASVTFQLQTGVAF